MKPETSSVDNKLNGDDKLTTAVYNIGSAVQVVKMNEHRKFEIDVDALSAILLRDSIRDTPVVVLSIAGDLRKGKSFLLNFFLRYLKKGCDGSSDWLGDDNTPLIGFLWRGGCESVTSGIHIWSEPFIVKVENGKEVAIILMDTQGVCDSEHTVGESATVFALSNMISSIQVFNLMHNLQEDNLQLLEIFTEYGKLAIESTQDKPFQKLLFLIRDWSSPDDFPYGLEGGMRFLDKKMEIKGNQPIQLQRIRRNISSCFSEINCFLMPYPGRKVATNKHFDSRLSEIDSEFAEQLRLLVLSLLNPKNLVIKEVGGRKVTGRDLFQYFKVYIKIFADQTVPEPKSIFEATADANNLSALMESKNSYLKDMEVGVGIDRAFIYPKMLEKMHFNMRNEALKRFDNIKKMGGQKYSILFREKLINDIESAYKLYEDQNNRKRTLYYVLQCYIITFCYGLKSLISRKMLWLLTSISCFLESCGILFINLLYWSLCYLEELRSLCIHRIKSSFTSMLSFLAEFGNFLNHPLILLLISVSCFTAPLVFAKLSFILDAKKFFFFGSLALIQACISCYLKYRESS